MPTQTKRVVIPDVDWHTALAEAVENADSQTVIIVTTEAQKELGTRAARRLGKKEINIQIDA